MPAIRISLNSCDPHAPKQSGLRCSSEQRSEVVVSMLEEFMSEKYLRCIDHSSQWPAEGDISLSKKSQSLSSSFLDDDFSRPLSYRETSMLWFETPWPREYFSKDF